MLLRDRLQARMSEMGDAPDYCRLASEVLGIRNAPPALARRLVSQALVVEDRREVWQQTGERICAAAPTTAGVYILRDDTSGPAVPDRPGGRVGPARPDGDGRVLYVGKAINLRRRLRTHFAARRWRGLKAPLARAAQAEWIEVGSELEALLREAVLIRELAPVVNVQIELPDLAAREIPTRLVTDVVVLLPSIEADSVELVAASPDGAWMLQRTRRGGEDLAVHARRLARFFGTSAHDGGHSAPLAPIVYSWLARRGANASRIVVRDLPSGPHRRSDRVGPSVSALQAKLRTLFADDRLFTERLVVR